MVQVVDLRRLSRPTGPTLEIWASPAAELLHLAALLQHGEYDSFDVGAARITSILDELPDDLVTDLVDSTSPHTWLVLTRLVAELDEPGTVEDLLAMLDERPSLAWRTVAEGECSAAGIDLDVDEELPGASLAEALQEQLADETDGQSVLDSLPDGGAVEFGHHVRDVLARLAEAVTDTLLVEALGPIRREVAARRQQLEGGAEVGSLVVEASNGYEAAMSTDAERILLLPSYWFRPWIICGRIGATEILSTAVPDEHLVLPSQAPPPALVKLCKALGDEGRLRLLRRMAGGAIQLADAMEELDVAKTTAHHHLAILRQAGLVVVRGEGRGTTYGLRADPAVTTQEMLVDYVGHPSTHRRTLAGG